MNSVSLCGRIIDKPTISTSNNNIKYSKIRISVEKYTKEEEKEYEVFEVVLFKNLAEMDFEVNQYVCVLGRLSSNNYEKDNVTYYNTSIYGTSVSILDL